jgi:hypothetical protein
MYKHIIIILVLVFIFSYVIFVNYAGNKCVKIFSGDQLIVLSAWEDISLFITTYLQNTRIYCSTTSCHFSVCTELISRVHSAVNNNNGFWIGRLDLLTTSVTFSLNHNQWLPKTRSTFVFVLSHSHSLHSLSSTTASFETRLSYIHLARTPRKTACIVDKACILGSCPAIYHLFFHAFVSVGMCLATSCLEMGMARTAQKTFLAIYFLLLRAGISGVA